MRAKIHILIFLICCDTFGNCNGDADNKELRSLTSNLEEKLEMKLQEYVVSAARWLEAINDRHLGESQLGRLMHYNEIKPKLDFTSRKDRSVKKMSMGMMPLVFHVGATSTWMLITSLMAAKSVAIGIALLVFKIAVSSARYVAWPSEQVASFFTALKSKHTGHHHHDWSYSPHYEHHGAPAGPEPWLPRAEWEGEEGIRHSEEPPA
ncbi:unnamed protein product, partial [Iphiclides podalirius]